MSEGNINIRAVIRPDIRNPFDKLLFWTNFLGGDPAKRTKESAQSAFRNIRQAKVVILIVSAHETHVVHSMQELFVREQSINEVELIAESRSESEPPRVSILPANFHVKKAATATVATLKLLGVKISSITPTKGDEDQLIYLVTLKFGVGSSLVSY